MTAVCRVDIVLLSASSVDSEDIFGWMVWSSKRRGRQRRCKSLFRTTNTTNNELKILSWSVVVEGLSTDTMDYVKTVLVKCLSAFCKKCD